MKAIFGNKLAPSFADHYLARNGYESQQRPEPANPNRPDNLYQPLEGDHGAHGAFDQRAREHSWEFWAESHVKTLGVALGVGVGLAGLLWAARRKTELRSQSSGHSVLQMIRSGRIAA